MANENLNDLTKEELIELCEKQEKLLIAERDSSSHWYNRVKKLESKLETLKNIIEL
jgi:hypothetical protein